MSRFLILLGITLFLAGLLWPWLSKLGMGRLPGDMVIRRESLTIFIPLGSSLAVSLVITLILWLFGR